MMAEKKKRKAESGNVEGGRGRKLEMRNGVRQRFLTKSGAEMLRRRKVFRAQWSGKATRRAGKADRTGIDLSILFAVVFLCVLCDLCG